MLAPALPPAAVSQAVISRVQKQQQQQQQQQLCVLPVVALAFSASASTARGACGPPVSGAGVFPARFWTEGVSCTAPWVPHSRTVVPEASRPALPHFRPGQAAVLLPAVARHRFGSSPQRAGSRAASPALDIAG